MKHHCPSWSYGRLSPRFSKGWALRYLDSHGHHQMFCLRHADHHLHNLEYFSPFQEQHLLSCDQRDHRVHEARIHLTMLGSKMWVFSVPKLTMSIDCFSIARFARAVDVAIRFIRAITWRNVVSFLNCIHRWISCLPWHFCTGILEPRAPMSKGSRMIHSEPRLF